MELLLGMGKKQLRHVAEDVRRSVGRELAQHVGGHSTGPATDLEDPDGGAFRQTFQCLRDSLLRQQVVDPVCRRVLVQVLGRRQRSLRKDQLKRIGVTMQYLGQLVAALTGERQFRLVRRERPPQRRPDALRVDCVGSAAYGPVVTYALEQAVLCQYPEQPNEQTAVLRHDPEAIGKLLRREVLTHNRLPTELPEGLENVRPGQDAVLWLQFLVISRAVEPRCQPIRLRLESLNDPMGSGNVVRGPAHTAMTGARL